MNNSIISINNEIDKIQNSLEYKLNRDKQRIESVIHLKDHIFRQYNIISNNFRKK